MHVKLLVKLLISNGRLIIVINVNKHENNYSWPPISSHRAACRHYWPALQTAQHAVHTGPTCTANHWEIAVHLVTGHDDRLQNVRRTHHRDGQRPTSVDTSCDARSSMKWCSRRSRLRPACEGRALTRPSWPHPLTIGRRGHRVGHVDVAVGLGGVQTIVVTTTRVIVKGFEHIDWTDDGTQRPTISRLRTNGLTTTTVGKMYVL